MDLSKHFILLNGEPKTLQIDAIQWNGSNGYSVRFKNNGRTYNYGRDKVVWLNNSATANVQEKLEKYGYQGREEDTIIMSVVDNKISEFADIC